METEESKELTLAQEETIKKTLEEIRKQDPKKNKRIYPIVVFGDEYDDKDVYIAYFREPDFIAFSKFVQLQKKDEIAAVRSLAHDTFIQGDKELVDDDSLFLYGLSTKLVNACGQACQHRFCCHGCRCFFEDFLHFDSSQHFYSF